MKVSIYTKPHASVFFAPKKLMCTKTMQKHDEKHENKIGERCSIALYIIRVTGCCTWYICYMFVMDIIYLQ